MCRESKLVPSAPEGTREERLTVPAEGSDEVLRSLDKISELVSERSQESPEKPQRSTRKPLVRPSTFDGKGSWEDYQAQFNIVAKLNDWTDDQSKATYLAVSLSGAARAVLGDLSEAERKNYEVLVKALDSRFGAGNQTEMHRATLRSRCRQKEESLPELAQAIRRLTRLAFPDVPPNLRDTMARDHFVDALSDPDVRWKVQQSRPKTLDEALTIAVELEAFVSADRQRARPVRAAWTSAELQDDRQPEQAGPSFQEELQQIKDLLLTLIQKAGRPRRPDGCWSCGERNNLARSCPKTQPQSSGNGKQPSSRA